jgi:hypothetical protein
MDGGNVLTHLLEIEEAAARIVKDANASAEKFLADSEVAGSSHFEAEYKRRRAELDADCMRQCAEQNARYTADMDDYKASLAALIPNQQRFNEAAAHFLMKEYR